MLEWEIIPKEKKGRALKKGTFGCLRAVHTLNVTLGCSLNCVYCYARAYAVSPPEGKIFLYSNLCKLLKKELSSKRNKVFYVVLNTASDCFQPYPDILDVTYETIEILLKAGKVVSFLTKGLIPERFFPLFEKYRKNLRASIGLVSLSKRYFKIFEPNAATPEQRIENIKNLVSVGITPSVRLDPLVPFFNDSTSEIEALFRVLKRFGIKEVVLNYLHLRPALVEIFKKELKPSVFKLINSLFLTQPWTTVGTSTHSKLVPKPLREKSYNRISELAKRYNIHAKVCLCKNPDLGGEPCVRFDEPKPSSLLQLSFSNF